MGQVLRAGDIVADRFVVRREAGAGGMGVVYQALDRVAGHVIALKVLEGRDDGATARFLREGELLADLQHPGIVRFLAHGQTPTGHRYLALEWLEGQDLARRLTRAGVTLAESVAIVKQIAAALGHAHARGIVHRDVKPSNIYLVGDDARRAKMLDFGVARLGGGASDMTAAGARIGTLAYMSPEQARGVLDLDGRADVFALGTVLYQCLTGRKPFEGDDPMALIGKILLADPVPVRDLARDVPPELEALVLRMLAKEPSGRPSDGTAVAAELEVLAPLLAIVGDRAARVRAPDALTGRERKLLCLILVHGGEGLAEAAELRGVAEGLGGRLEPLVDGSLVVVVSGTAAATDLAARAARIALSLKQSAPEAPVALATGRGVVVSDSLPLSEVLDRASRLLRTGAVTNDTLLLSGELRTRTGAPEKHVRLDEVTAGLLDARFEVGGDEHGLLLLQERPQFEAARTLLGKPTPCVARDAELATIEATYAACADEREARAVIVTSPAGVGKSRVRHEAMRRITGRDDPPEVLVGRGDPMSAGAPFGLLAEALRRSAGLEGGEPLAVRQRKLRARVGRYLTEGDARRVAEFLGEMIGTPFDGDVSVQLRAARADARLMGDQMRRAWEDWLAAETDAGPVMLVLEDLHWGDQPTVGLVDTVLRNLHDRPLFVLALARPEVHQLFPRLWAERTVQEIRLGELGRKACERLIRQVLGKGVTDEVVTRLADRSAGNAFYLEELIRAAAEGRGDDLPETVLAMVQARLEGMEAEARQVLRAASVFGQVFWHGAVQALLGGERTPGSSDWLGELVRREVISQRPSSQVRGEKEYTFRHALVREAAYAMLTDSDRSLGHKLAGEWLEKVGEPEAVVLAEHFERGGDPERAAGWWRRSAEQALGGNDLAAVLERVDRGLSCHHEPLDGPLRVLKAEAHSWRGEFPLAEEAAREAMAVCPAGGDLWYAAVGEAALAAGVQGRSDVLRQLFAELAQVERAETPGDREVNALTRVAEQLLITGSPELADKLLAGLDELATRLAQDKPELAAKVFSALTLRRRFAGDAGAARELAAAAIGCFERAGDVRQSCHQRGRVGYALLEIGEYAAAERALREVIGTSDRMGLANVASSARHNLGLTLSRLGKHEEARTVEAAAAAEFRALGNRRMEGASLEYLALIELEAGNASAAETAARGAVHVAEAEPRLPLNLAESLAILGQALLAQGRVADAHAAAANGLHLLEQLGGIDDGEAIIRLTWAETLYAGGETQAAREAIHAARDRLLHRAEKITDEALRKAFLEQVPENVKTLSLAGRW
jgi:eukaryotic-like serine/threonine-protein kinase